MKFLYICLKKLILLSLLFVIAGSGVSLCIGWYVWTNAQAVLTESCRNVLRDKFPAWPIEFQSTVLDGDGVLRINDVVIRSPVYGDELITIPEIHIEIDKQEFISQQKVRVKQVHFRNPLVRVWQRENGLWNLQELPPPPKDPHGVLPQLVIEGGSCEWVINPQNPASRTSVFCDKIDLSCVSDENRKLNIHFTSMLGPVGMIECQGAYQLDGGQWNMEGRLPQVRVGNDLINLLLSIAPNLEEPLAKLNVDRFQNESRVVSNGSNIESVPDRAYVRNNAVQGSSYGQGQHYEQGKIAQVSMTQEQTGAGSAGSAGSVKSPQGVDLGTELMLESVFRVGSQGDNQVPSWEAATRISQGRIVHPALPFPLYEITGEFLCNQVGVKLNSLKATNGVTRLETSGSWHWKPVADVDQMKFHITDLTIDDRLNRVMPKELNKVYDELNPNGPVDVSFRIFQSNEGKIDWFLTELLCKNISVKIKRFPYPLANVQGKIWQDDRQNAPTLILFNVEGLAGQQTVWATGGIVNPGPGYESVIDVGVSNIPLDENLRAALPASVKKIVDEMKLLGKGDFRIRLTRPPVKGQDFKIQLTGAIREGSMNWTLFPFALHDMTGQVEFENHRWKFTNLKARHDETEVLGYGVFSTHDPVEMLNFHIKANKAYFDQSLEMAIAACGQAFVQTWKEVNPSGKFDLDVQLSRAPQKPIELYFNRIETEDAEINLRSFPYRLHNVKTLVTGPSHDLMIKHFNAFHDLTRVIAKGQVQVKGPQWHLKIYDFHVDDLNPDHTFRAALTKHLRDPLEGMAIKDRLSGWGEFSLHGGLNERDPVTGEWDMNLIMSGISLIAGLDIKNVYGTATSKGFYDHAGIVHANGQLNIDSLEIEKYQVLQVKGPWAMNGEELVLGSRRMFENSTDDTQAEMPTAAERITGLLYDGTVTLDAIALMQKQNPYRVRITMHDGKLESWAKTSGYGTSNIRGNMNGWVDLQGDNNWKMTQTGRGRLWISPAEIYELPMMIRIFRALQFSPSDKTAFRYSFADFHITGHQFLFDHIDLIGESISLVGSGYIQFDRRIALDFDSIMPRSQVPIPLLNSLVNNPLIRGASRGIIAVKVRGTLNDPSVQVNAGVPLVSDAVEALMKTVDRGNNELKPLLAPPPRFSNPKTPPNVRVNSNDTTEAIPAK
jgi:hypothetical protein